jgi:formylglycine-generating enzyme required for sulfatase activity
MGIEIDLDGTMSADLAGTWMEQKEPFEPEMALIPSGEFLMGSDPGEDKNAADNEQPQHTIFLPDYALGKTPVTNAQYSAFLKATGHKPPVHWKILFWRWRRPPFGRDEYPAVNVTWHDALAYCRWLAKVTGKPYRLPNEPEWEKGARGIDGRIFPWGDEWDPDRCYMAEQVEKEHPIPVGQYPDGASPYGLLDVVGNVWEWTRSLWGKSRYAPEYTYPYDPQDGRENLLAGSAVRRVLRGASFYNDRTTARCAARYRYSPRNRFNSVGFRVVISPMHSESQSETESK